jgi:hypothetical protein
MQHTPRRIRIRRATPLVAALVACATGCGLAFAGGSSKPVVTTTASGGTNVSVAGAPARKAWPDAGKIYTVPSKIPADCSASASIDISVWLATVPNGATAKFAKNGCYGEDGEIVVNDRQNLLIDGNGSTFKTLTPETGTGRKNWHVTGGRNITFQNLTLQGELTFTGPYTTSFTPADTYQHGIEFDGVQGATVRAATIGAVLGDFVEAAPDRRTKTWVPTRNLLVTDSVLIGSGRQGVGITDADGVTLSGNYIGYVNRDGIDIEPNYATELGRNIQIVGNTFDVMRFAQVASQGAGGAPNVENITVAGNTVINQQTTCLPFVYSKSPAGAVRTNLTVTANSSLSYQTTVEASGISGLTVTNNTAKSTKGTGGCNKNVAVLLAAAAKVKITGNKFANVSVLSNIAQAAAQAKTNSLAKK